MELKKDKIFGYFKDIPGWAKGIIIIIIIILIALLVYKFYNTVGFKTTEERKEERDLEKDIDNLLNKNQKPTFLRSQYKGFADTIEAENKSINTNEDKIYGIFKQMNNDLDIVLLREAFGNRRPSLDFYERNLDAFLNSDLNESEIEKINKILESKGIKYRF